MNILQITDPNINFILKKNSSLKKLFCSFFFRNPKLFRSHLYALGVHRSHKIYDRYQHCSFSVVHVVTPVTVLIAGHFTVRRCNIIYLFIYLFIYFALRCCRMFHLFYLFIRSITLYSLKCQVTFYGCIVCNIHC